MVTRQASVILRFGKGGAPEQLDCDGGRYRVSDIATPPDWDWDWDWASLTHAPRALIGWRFQGTDELGHSRVFDVLFNEARGGWELLRSYI